MTEWHDIVIREFWDIPRAVVAMRGNEMFYFYSPFDESLDDYTSHYQAKAIERLEDLPLKNLPFDISRVRLRDEVTKLVSGKDHKDG